VVYKKWGVTQSTPASRHGHRASERGEGESEWVQSDQTGLVGLIEGADRWAPPKVFL
jgi:hypothetical protein